MGEGDDDHGDVLDFVLIYIVVHTETVSLLKDPNIELSAWTLLSV